MKHISQNLAGIYLMISGIVLYTLSDVFIKTLLIEYPVSEVAFIRSILRGLPIFVMILIKDKNLLFSKRYDMHIVRVLFGSASTIFFIMSLEYGGMTNVYTIGYSCSLFIVLFSSIFLKEKIGLGRSGPVLMGMFGVYLAMKPRFELITNVYLLAPLLGVICGAMNRIVMKKLSSTDHPLTIMLYVNVGLFFMSLTCCSDWKPITESSIKTFLIMGALALLSQHLIAWAIKKADASLLAHCDYSSFVIVVLLDIFYWDKAPDIDVILGAAIIIVSNILVIYRERSAIRKCKDNN